MSGAQPYLHAVPCHARSHSLLCWLIVIVSSVLLRGNSNSPRGVQARCSRRLPAVVPPPTPKLDSGESCLHSGFQHHPLLSVGGLWLWVSTGWAGGIGHSGHPFDRSSRHPRARRRRFPLCTAALLDYATTAIDKLTVIPSRPVVTPPPDHPASSPPHAITVRLFGHVRLVVYAVDYRLYCDGAESE